MMRLWIVILCVIVTPAASEVPVKLAYGDILNTFSPHVRANDTDVLR